MTTERTLANGWYWYFPLPPSETSASDSDSLDYQIDYRPSVVEIFDTHRIMCVGHETAFDLDTTTGRFIGPLMQPQTSPAD